jgi:hypothetical protein
MQKEQNTNNIDTIQHKKRFDIKYTHMQSQYNKTIGGGGTFSRLMSHFQMLGIPQQSKRREYLSTFLMLLYIVSVYS